MKNTWKITLLAIALLGTVASVYPPKFVEGLSNDTLVNFQWPLKNLYVPGDENIRQHPERAGGHLVRKDLTDVLVDFISSQPVDGSQKTYDLQWSKQVEALAESKKEEPIIVAVLDSGVNWTHPDLADAIAKKDSECARGRIPPAGRDNDKNGFDGDCMGWNFTVGTKSPARNRPKDGLGHGTHVAGIIAAIKDNRLGVSGLSSSIKILPVKVVGVTQAELDQANEVEDPGEILDFTDQLAKGLEYAIKEGAQVVNLSMGWPRIANVDKIKKAIDLAAENNVVIVAAAGNNSHSSQIYPCASPNVICVGSIDNNGAKSGFSNYGGQVDVLAPGNGIISTFPTDITPKNFDLNSYEILNGTSQAAPFVTGLVALMKLKYPNISSRKILAKLIQTSRPVYTTPVNGVTQKDYRSVGGTVQFNDALFNSEGLVVVPRLKELMLIPYDTNTNIAKLDFPVEVLSGNAQNVEVKILSERNDIAISPSQISLGALKDGETKHLAIQALLANDQVESQLQFSVEIYVNGTLHRKVDHGVQISRSLKNDARIKTLPFALNNKFKESNLRPVSNVKGAIPSPVFFQTNLDQENGVEIQFSRVTGDNIVKSTPLLIPHLQNVPLGLDGIQIQAYGTEYKSKELFLIVGVFADKTGAPWVQISYLNEKFEPALGRHSHLGLPLTKVAPDFKNLRLVPYSMAGLGEIPVPVFVGVGGIPQLDEEDPLEFRNPNAQTYGIYFLEPHKVENGYQLRERQISTYKFENRIKARLGLSSRQRLELVGLMIQSAADEAKGQVSALYSYDFARSNKNAIVSLDRETLKSRSFGIKKLKPGLNFTRNAILPVTGLSGARPNLSSASSMYALYQRTKIRSQFFNDAQNPTANLRYVAQDRKELIFNILSSFELPDSSISIIETGFKTIAIVKEKSGKTTIHKRQVIRSTFLPGFLFSESLSPTPVKSGKSWKAGLYVDATAILSNNILIWTVDKEGARVPVALNMLIPEGCRTVDRVWWEEQEKFFVALMCGTAEYKTLKFVPIEAN